MDLATEPVSGAGLSVRTADGIATAEVSGELDISWSPALREQLLSVLRRGSSRLVIDLSRVTYCDVSGLVVLVGTGHRARLLGGSLRLAAISPQVEQVLHATGLHAHFDVFATVHAATAGAQGPADDPSARDSAA
jgi:anti-sigma B factor antagonist